MRRSFFAITFDAGFLQISVKRLFIIRVPPSGGTVGSSSDLIVLYQCLRFRVDVVILYQITAPRWYFNEVVVFK